MADAALSFLLDNVKKLLVEQIDLISGAEKELKELQNELELMKAFLMDSANKREKGEVFSQFGRQIRDAVYEVEDNLDACLTHKARGLGSVFGSRNRDLAKKVKEQLQLLQPLFERAMRSLNAQPVLDRSVARPEEFDHKLKKTQLLREEHVLALADEKAILIEHLLEQTEEIDVISIVGMPGIGKTTLARKIYGDPNIQLQFLKLIWVYVSQTFNARDAFLTILKSLTDRDMSTKEDHKLTEEVRSHLDKAGRFLIILDDVWTIRDWRIIKEVLPRNNKSGKVLITSRYERVAMQANRYRDPYRLRFLTLDESWELLQFEVFGRNKTCPMELEGLGMQIVTQCGGVPLAIVLIGGILAEKCVDRRDLWEKVLDSVDGSAYLRDDDEKRTERIIALSYNKLPHELRDCFLYIGIFPEDTEIPVWQLTRLWIAEGFVQQSMGQSLEEVAEDRLNDLVARNLVMVEKTRADGSIKTCRVHDMIREFCQNEAAFANKNLFQEVKKTRQGVFDPAMSEIVNCRRLSIHSDVIEFLHKKPKGPSVRSFVCFNKETIMLPEEATPSIPEAFNLLRVLDVIPLKFTRFPLKLTKLMHLRYISLSGNEFKSLPEAVSRLWNLQTVKIDTMLPEFEIKVDISKMVQLRHLKTKAAICLEELKGEGGENLQTLSRLSVKCCKKGLFSRASNLRNLGIRGNLTSFVDANYLGELGRLEKLKLVHDVSPEAAGIGLHHVPDQHSFPPNLKSLSLSSTYLGWNHMTTLGSLPSLEVLKLMEMAFTGRIWEAQGGGFLQLESLHIGRTDLEIWTASGDPFPKLKNLIVKNCERLREIPSQVGKCLQLVEIEHVTPSLLQSAKNIREEKQQMQGGEMRAKTGGFNLKLPSGDA